MAHAAPESTSTVDMDARYQQRLARYVTAMRNEKPDMIPLRPFVAEFTGTYAGYDCQQLAHDYNLAFEAACRTAADFDWDAVVANMVYVWTGLAQVIGLNYYGIPGIDVPADRGFQYREPPESESFMRADEYDQLIADPTGYLLNVWLPRVANPVQQAGDPVTLEHNLSFLKGGMAMLQYFSAFPGQIARLRRESGTVSAIAGIFKAPMDIIADKLRGYYGLVEDLLQRPDQVLAACEALMPYLYRVATTTADPDKNVPVGYWMHRGCVPFVNPDQFNNIYWPTVKPIIEELWADGHQTLFYAEGNWDYHLERFAELPDLSIVYHVDQGDIFKAHQVFGHKFCLSGGVPNYLLAFSTPEDVRRHCRKIIEGVAGDGGYIMDASAIVQNDGKVENLRAMTEMTREIGGYSDGHSTPAAPVSKSTFQRDDPNRTSRMPAPPATAIPPGHVVPWETQRKQMVKISGNEQIVQDIWNNVDALANMYIWQILLSF